MRKKKNNNYPWKVDKAPQTGRLEKDNRYNSARWRKLRKLYIDDNPLCAISLRNGQIVSADVVDHIHPVRLGGSFWSEKNWQSLSSNEHNKKSGFEAQFSKIMAGKSMGQVKLIYVKASKIIFDQHKKQMHEVNFIEVKNIIKYIDFEQVRWRGRGLDL